MTSILRKDSIDSLQGNYEQLFETIYLHEKDDKWRLIKQKPKEKEKTEYFEKLAESIVKSISIKRVLNLTDLIKRFNNKRTSLTFKKLNISCYQIDEIPEKKILKFNGKHPTLSFLSNFFPTIIFHEKNIYSSSEHAYLAWKNSSSGSAVVKEIKCSSASKAKKISQKIKKKTALDQLSSRSKILTMKKIVKEKFEQNPLLMQKLNLTMEYKLVEETKDHFWGSGDDGKGENYLGRIIEEVRDDKKKEQFSQES